MDYKFENIPLIDFIKMITVYRGMTLRKLLLKLCTTRGYSNAYAGFYNKLKNRTLKFDEMKDIAEVLGYEIIFKDIKN